MRFHPSAIAALVLVGAFSLAQESPVQNSARERRFALPVGTIQAALQKLPGGTSGRLPVLDGFVVPGPHPLSSYQRPYYQCQVRVTAAPGGSLVQVTAKITAWFSGPEHSGYQALVSNGRVEADLLDRLQEAVEAPSATQRASAVKALDNPTRPKAAAPEIDAPVPQLPDRPASSPGTVQEPINPQDSQLQQEAKSLEEILRNQSHPTNLIAVRQSGTPVLQSPATDAKVLFLASAEDEFEVLDQTPGWVHVRISGLSRGWLRRSLVEMLGESQVGTGSAGAVAVAKAERPGPSDPQSSALFSVSSEEVGSFPGDWTPLKGKNVKIISLQQASGTGRITSPQEKKQFAEALFKKESRGLPADAAALVLVFDAEDGGMLAAPRAALDQWNSGTLTDSAFWKQCYLDPPEILGAN